MSPVRAEGQLRRQGVFDDEKGWCCVVIKTLDRWAEIGKEQGAYAVFDGFEQAIRKLDNEFSDAYESLDIVAQVQLFAFICDLLLNETTQG